MTDKKALTIHEAMLKFHKEFEGAQKSGKNKHFGSDYFTLDDLIEATTPILQKCGLYVSHHVEGGYLWTGIINEHGDAVRSSIKLPETQNPQIMGANLTYFKKYNMTGLMNIPESDDDGNMAAAAADLEEQKARQKEIVPKPEATDEQKATIQEYIEKYVLDTRYVAYIKANIEKMSVDDADHEIQRLVKAETDKTLKEI